MDPKRFVDQFVGTQGMYRTAQISDYLRSVIISKMTDVIAENMTSILDLPKLFDELSAAMRATLQDDFLAMGIALKQFRIVSISPTEETAKAMDERAAMGAIGDMQAYMQFKAARAMGDAAQQPGGGSGEGLGLGAGIGMGVGMAGMIANAMNAGQQQQPQQAQTPAAAAGAAVPDVMTLEEAAAYLKVSPADIQALIDEGQINARKIGSQYRISKGVIDQFLAG
ncbi:MAG: SPFH domain-containing protein [Caldilineaceae bacterium]